jgi:hypothetical protein
VDHQFKIKTISSDGSHQNDMFHNWIFTTVAFATECRLIVAFVIGPRKQYIADELLELTANRLSGPRPHLSLMV